MWLPLADTVIGIPVDQINALSQIGLTGGALLVIGLFIIGKLTAGYLLDRAEARATALQVALDKSQELLNAVPKAIADLTTAHASEIATMTAAHEREVASLSAEVRRVGDAVGLRPTGG